MTFWEIYESLCASIGKKPNPVVKELGISSGAITQCKNGSIPSGEKLIQIADYFNVSVDYLLGRTDEPTEEEADMSVSNSDTDKTTAEFIQIFTKLPIMDRIEIMSLARDKVKQSNIAV